MSVRRITLGAAAQPDSGRAQPRRQRLGLLFILSLGGGGVAGVLAFIIIWVPTIYALANSNTSPSQLAAKSLFPPAAAVHKTVNVFWWSLPLVTPSGRNLVCAGALGAPIL